MILDGYYWSVWSILMLIESQINEKIFNFAFVSLRAKMNEFYLQQDFIKEAVEGRIKRFKESKQ